MGHYNFGWVLGLLALFFLLLFIAVPAFSSSAIASTITPLLIACIVLDLVVTTVIFIRNFAHRNITVAERLIGQNAIVIEPLQPEGRVMVHGENWIAIIDPDFEENHLAVGSRVRILDVQDLTVHVVPLTVLAQHDSITSA